MQRAGDLLVTDLVQFPKPGPLLRGGWLRFGPEQWIASFTASIILPHPPAFTSVSSVRVHNYKERVECLVEPHPPIPPSHSHVLPHTLLSLAMTQTQSNIPKDFNPFTIHGFTNGNAVEHNQPPPQPSKYPRPIPSSATQYLAGTPAHMQTPRQPSSTNNTIHSPEPRRPIPLAKAQQQRHREPIFIPFHQDRSSPELEEILLRKKLAKTLGSAALGR